MTNDILDRIKIKFYCQCGDFFICSPKYAGRKIRCPSCKDFYIVPGLAQKGSDSEDYKEIELTSSKKQENRPDNNFNDYSVDNDFFDAIQTNNLSEKKSQIDFSKEIQKLDNSEEHSEQSETVQKIAKDVNDSWDSSLFITDDSNDKSQKNSVKTPNSVTRKTLYCPNPISSLRRFTYKTSKTLNNYRIINVLAEGGMGSVCLARDDNMERTVAVKEIKKARRNDLEYQKRLIVEAKITGSLDHPGIVPVYSLEFDEQGSPFYIMRKIDGKTFDNVIQEYHRNKRPLKMLKELLRHFIAVCQTITYSHSINVIHRDLKPSNLMIGRYGATFVMDWGIAKRYQAKSSKHKTDSLNQTSAFDSSGESDLSHFSVEWLKTDSSVNNSSYATNEEEDQEDEEKLQLTQLNARLGTRWYRDPDYLRTGTSHPYNDIYALGVILYMILTGKLPYAESGMNEKTALLMGSPKRPIDLNHSIPKPLSTICMKAIAQKPEERYSSAERLADDIQRWLENEPVSVYRYSFWERLFKKFQ
ncbi:MAG: serine/threonine-protein kinase [Planctomycetia bacterium]|nr:serine/threonine-protein kinase [Planctomycetia bacterium]